MKYRGFQKVSTGEWLTALFTTEGATFSAGASSQEADFATALGIDASDVSATDADADPRTGTLLSLSVASDAGLESKWEYEISSFPQNFVGKIKIIILEN